MKTINQQVLVLDKAYMPLNIVSAKKAMTYIVKQKAVVLEDSSEIIKSAKTYWQVPSVIKLSNFVAQSSYSKLKVKFNKKTLFERDKRSCQYCLKQLTRDLATVDHVIPRGGGFNGVTSWENCVIACKECNTKKGNRTPQQANMALSRQPKYPHYLTYLNRTLSSNMQGNDQWKLYFIL